MVEEMMPAKVQVCKNVTRYFHNCSTEMTYTEVEEEWPLCKVEMMNRNHTSCQEEEESGLDSLGETCKKVMKCQIGRKMNRNHTSCQEEEESGLDS